jgi:hypothetical protein
LTALDRLRSESSVFQFQATGTPPHHYNITFRGKGLWRDRGKVKIVHTHRVEIKLGASYPRTIPEIRWLTPIYHPNISEIGMVCLGGYGTHWVPSVQLDELCMMLWDMARYHNYDIRSPYNRNAALWVANQSSILFPTDSRPLRDLRVAQGRIDASNGNGKPNGTDAIGKERSGGGGRRSSATPETGLDSLSAVVRVRQFIERYGRVLSEMSRLEPDTASVTTSPEPSVPGPTSSAGSMETTNDPAPVSLETLAGPIEPSRPDDDGLIILEEATDPAAEPQRPLPVAEEIVFID